MSITHLATPLLRSGIRAVRAIGAPIVNTVSARRREREGLGKPVTRQFVVSAVGRRSALEIGPFFSPLLTGDHVSYFDVLDQAALRRRAVEVGGTPATVPPIRYVSPVGDLSVVDRKFEVVLSAHAIEHQPDLVAHLASVADLLEPRGTYWAIVPDRRYSFDYPLKESTLAQVLDAHAAKRAVHSPADVLAHLGETGHNNALLHWLGLHTRRPSRADTDRRAFALAEAQRAERGEYVDVHAWIFTPQNFTAILSGLRERGLSRFAVDEVTETAFGKLEFMARLTLVA